jgi:gamma-glutamyltranspeptidase / glutathione hydrolase
MYLDAQGNVDAERSQKGRLAAGVPGSVAGMWESHQKYGKLPWKVLVAEAIKVAESGFAITKQEADNLNTERTNFLKHNYYQPEQFLKAIPWQAGDLLIQKELARTLKIIQKKGKAGFYSGEIAGRIATDALKGNGIITIADLANYQPIWRNPVTFDYKDCSIISMPPPSSGGILLAQMMGMITPYDIAKMGFHSTESVHLMAEVERRAFADRAQHLGDPDFWKVPQKAMTSESYLLSRMRTYSPSQATKSATLPAGSFSSEETTHLSIVDAAGNAVAVTTTLNDSYGSRAVVQGAGFILNNEMDDFSAKPGVPNLYGLVGSEANAIAPQKRMLSSMTPTIVLRNNKLWLVVGTPGGSTIPTSVFQTILNLREFNLPLNKSVHELRFHHQHLPDQISIEKNAFTPEVIAELRALGHTVIERGPIGRVEAILIEPNGTLRGVADTRGDDAAAGY